MSWDTEDLNNFQNANKNNIGQISMDSVIGNFLYNMSKDDNIKSILEIGTWNGLGSTKCIVNGIQERKTSAIFYSLECNVEKSDSARKYYQNIDNIYILNEVLLNDMPTDIYDVFPVLKTNETYKYWNNVDFENMKDKPLFLNRTDLPEIFDLILLDGGEFTTWYEYLQIKDKCKYLALDDTNVDKCKKIVEDIKSQPNKWKILIESNERNGTVVAVRV
jgi:hypothetical protein